jgi:hypothetical protein
MCEPALWQKKYAEIAPSKYYIKLTRACCTSNTSCTQVLHTEQPSTIRQPFSFPEITGGQQKKKKKKKKTMVQKPPTKATASQILQRGRERGAPKSETKKK